ncbi:caspase domain-containing protein [Dongia sp.]|uniref:caspase family protein n=1 Tax=Dongia sp. TaxID=1977262 RepID=UPI00375332E4
MISKVLSVVAGLCLFMAGATTAQAEPRVALVVGNSNYGSEIGKLPNPVNDANLVAQALQQTGFTVVKVTDVDQKSLKRAIIEFGDKLTAAGPETTGLFFYAGHGVQVKGMNYLIPVGADIGKESDVGLEAISADEVLQQMEYAGARVNIVILDACRNNPLARGFRSASRGLAPMDATRGTFIAYSTSPGDVSADGDGKNSPYSAALAKTIVQPGIGIEEAFRDVRAQVMSATDEKQVPWDSSSLTAPFFFSGGIAKPAAVTTAPAASSLEVEKVVWDAIKDSKQAGDYQAYLDQYPNGAFASIAKSRMASLGGAPAPAPAAATVAPTAAKSGAEKAMWDSISTSKQAGDYQAFLDQYPQGTYAPLARSRLAELNRAVPAVPAQPQAAPAATAAPESTPAAESASPPAEESSGGIFGASPKVEYDSKGVDCRIMDLNRSESECRNTKKPKKPNKPRG